MTTGDVSFLFGVGMFGGIVGGLVGIGGAVIMIPGMVIVLGTGQHVAQGAALIVNCFVAAPAAWQHLRHGAVIASVVRVLVPAAAIAAILGVWVSELPFFAGAQQVRLSQLFGVFLLYVAAYNAWRVLRPLHSTAGPWSASSTRTAIMAAALVGLPTGFAGGLLGLGGGIVCVPLQQVFLRLPLRNAIANSTATLICVSLIGAVAKNYYLVSQGTSFWTMGLLAVGLIPAAFAGGLLGGKLTHVLPQQAVRVVLGLLLLAASYKLLSRTVAGTAAREPAVSIRASALPDLRVRAGQNDTGVLRREVAGITISSYFTETYQLEEVVAAPGTAVAIGFLETDQLAAGPEASSRRHVRRTSFASPTRSGGLNHEYGTLATKTAGTGHLAA